MIEITVGYPYPPEGSHVVTLYALVALPQDEVDDDPDFSLPTWAEELFSEVEESIRKMALSYASIAILEGARTLAPKSEGTMENLTDVDAMEDKPLTPAEIARNAEIEVDNELVEAQKAFHRKTAAFIMSLEHYQRIARIKLGVQNPPDPVVGDMINGYPLIVREDGGKPHLEMVDNPLRPSFLAGVTSFGVERDFNPIPFADPISMGGFSETEPAESVPSGHEEAAEAEDGNPATPAPEH